MALYRTDPSTAEPVIENFLQEAWRSFPSSERPGLLKKLNESVRALGPGAEARTSAENGEVSRLFSLLLGQKVSTQDLCSEEFIEKLGKSLNTIFDTLNQISEVIHSTLLGRKEEMETIRLIIGSALKGEGTPESLQNYLNRIREAFLVSHRAFRQAAQKKIRDLMNELDPERIAAMGKGTLDFSPFHKGKLFEIYKEEFMKCRGLLESGRLMEEVLREFEKNCQKQYQAGQGRPL